MPEPIPVHTLKVIKAQKGLSFEEKLWSALAAIATIVAAVMSYFTMSPMPFVLAFAFAAITVARLEVEDF